MRKFRLSTLLLFVTACVIFAAYLARQRQIESQTTGEVRSRIQAYTGGEEVQVQRIGNSLRTLVSVVIIHRLPDTSEIAEIKRPNKIQTRWSMDGASETNGLWVNGEKQDLSQGILVVYMNNLVPPSFHRVSQDDAQSITSDFENLDLVDFIKKWVPDLP